MAVLIFLPDKITDLYGILDTIYNFARIFGVCPYSRKYDDKLKKYTFSKNSLTKNALISACVILCVFWGLCMTLYDISKYSQRTQFDLALFMVLHTVLCSTGILCLIVFTLRASIFMDSIELLREATEIMKKTFGVYPKLRYANFISIITRLSFFLILTTVPAEIFVVKRPLIVCFHELLAFSFPFGIQGYCFHYFICSLSVIYEMLQELNSHIVRVLRNERDLDKIKHNLLIISKLHNMIDKARHQLCLCLSSSILNFYGTGLILLECCFLAIFNFFPDFLFDGIIWLTIFSMMFTALACLCDFLEYESKRTGIELCGLILPRGKELTALNTLLYQLLHQQHEVIIGGWFVMNPLGVLKGFKVVASFQMLLLQLRGNIE